jgi:hypothetical protein
MPRFQPLIGHDGVVLRRRHRRPPDGPESTYLDLRDQALDAGPSLPAPPREHRNVLGAVVDVPMERGSATIVALTDGTTSMYTSTGGGIIGAGMREPVAEATHALLATIEPRLGSFAPSADRTLPDAATVRFHVLTPHGRHTADVPEEAFWGRAPHTLVPVIAATQHVVTLMREGSPD